MKDFAKSSSKILAFVTYVGGLVLTLKLLGGNVDVEAAIKVYTISIVVSGLLVGNKTISQLLERLIDKKFGGQNG